jgi:hypothetical protein
MNAPSASQNDPQRDIEVRLRTLRIVWIALLLTIGIYYGMTLFVARSKDETPNPTLSLVLMAVGASTTLASFVIKNMLLKRAVDQRQTGLVQQAYVTTWAITEVAALLGVLSYFLAGDRYYPVLFFLSVCGMLLHFPRREPLENAGFKSSTW